MKHPLSLAAFTMASCGLGACGVGVEKLMPTPLVYHGGDVDPFAELDGRADEPHADIFFITDRTLRERSAGPIFLDTPSDDLTMGAATVTFGDDDHTWEMLHAASTQAERDPHVDLGLGPVEPIAAMPMRGAWAGPPALTDEQLAFAAAVNDRLAAAPDPEIFIYVHGAKVDFYNSCVLTGELHHFCGRDFVPIAFSWSTGQTIFTYLNRRDVREANRAGAALAEAIVFLAAHTDAHRINVLSYSAGGRVLAHALTELQAAHAELDGRALRDELRLGLAFFASADVPLAQFLPQLPAVHAVAERVIATMSDGDHALFFGRAIMGGGQRLGQVAAMSDAERAELLHLPRVELIDVSYAKEDRGFDITGHGYWYAHPWVSSDVVLALRTRLPAAERGLEPTGTPRVWSIPPDYPARAREIGGRVFPPGPPPAG